MQQDRPLDVAVVGGGIGGIVCLHYARKAGLDAVLLEKQDAVGGLWRRLPAWQDIQISPVDWALGDLPLAGPTQPAILANIEAWVDRFGLAGHIRLGSPVLRAHHADGAWQLDTPGGVVRARHLVAASGAHNTPRIPAVDRRGATVRELHSSELRDASGLAGKDVLVVGGGSSALDLLDLCFEHGARRVAWVYRSLKWFTPTGKPKAVAGSVRPYARMQVSGMTLEQQTAAIRDDMLGRYQKFGIEAILPERPFDLRRDQLVPGRHRMLANFAAIERHRGEVQAIDGGAVVLQDGTRLQPDLLLWATGYGIDLSYFAQPRIAAIGTLDELAARCGGGFRSVDAPDLYFPQVGLDGIGSAPWAYSLLAQSIVSHIRGTARLDMEPLPHRIHHFDLVEYLAPRDPGTYPDADWRQRFRALALGTPDDQPYPIP
jgi:cation diffusion facilitator CzcD-associated flavoprotein CzcO